MTIGDTLRGMLGEFRANLSELAHQDELRISEVQQQRRDLAAKNAAIDEQREIILKLRAELIDEQQRAAIAQAGLDKAALMLGERQKLGRGVRDPGEATVIDIGDSRLLAHLRALLAILDEAGGYMPTHHQETISAARKAVADGE